MSAETYTPPVSELLSHGGYDVASAAEWPDYLALGFGQEHIPELIRMVTDKSLLREEASDLEFFASLHAMRTLGQLKAEAAIEPLLTIFDIAEDNDWLQETMPQVYGMIGPAAIPALTAFLADQTRSEYHRAYASDSLAKIAKVYPETRSDIITTLIEQLTQSGPEDYEFKAFIITDLAHLKAVEVLPFIEEAFKAGLVDESTINLEDVLVDMGLKEREVHNLTLDELIRDPFAHRGTKIDPNSIQIITPSSPLSSVTTSPIIRSSAPKKEKNKRKTAKLARKKNKRKM